MIERVNYMNSAQKVVRFIMGVVLLALCIIGATCDLSIALKVCVVLSAFYGFFELYKWSKSK